MNFKFKSIDANNFTKFSSGQFEFASGINVLIGKNGTGKTHLLKLLYAIAKINSNSLVRKENFSFKELATQKLKGIFKISDISKLSRNSHTDKDFIVNYHLEKNSNDFFIQYFSAKNEIVTSLIDINQLALSASENAVYLPTQEMLTGYNEFIPFYEKYDVKFDETLYYLAKSLNDPKLKEKTEFQKRMLVLIHDHLGGDLIKENNVFYLNTSHGKIEATLLAEGIKKLALSGVQIFLATHDYLLTHQLSLLDEYRDSIENNTASIKFFCLEDSKEEGVKVFSGTNLTHIQNNPILEEFASHYDRERELFERSMNRG